MCRPHRGIHGRQSRHHPCGSELPVGSSPIRAQTQLLQGTRDRGVCLEVSPPDQAQVLHRLRGGQRAADGHGGGGQAVQVCKGAGGPEGEPHPRRRGGSASTIQGHREVPTPDPGGAGRAAATHRGLPLPLPQTAPPHWIGGMAPAWWSRTRLCKTSKSYETSSDMQGATTTSTGCLPRTASTRGIPRRA